MATGAKTQRERDFINAMAAFYTNYDKVDHRTRVLAYLKAMEGVTQAFPNDDEAQILYAIELNVAGPPSDKTYAMQLKGAAILEPIFQRQPQHPGVARYLIHLYDTPALAETQEPGVTVSLVARRHAIAPNQLFVWRRLASQAH
jgi:transposase